MKTYDVLDRLIDCFPNKRVPWGGLTPIATEVGCTPSLAARVAKANGYMLVAPGHCRRGHDRAQYWYVSPKDKGFCLKCHGMSTTQRQLDTLNADADGIPASDEVGEATVRPGLGGRDRTTSTRAKVLDYIERVYPCGAIPYGALTDIGEVFGVTRERVRQIVNAAEVQRVARASQQPRKCWDCDRQPPKGKRYCEEHATVLLVCPICDGEFRLARNQIHQRLRQKGHSRVAPQFFCSRKCWGSWAGKRNGFGVHGKGGFAPLSHCRRGHEFTPENTYEWRGRRQCRACIQLRYKSAAAATPTSSTPPPRTPAPALDSPSATTSAATSASQEP